MKDIVSLEKPGDGTDRVVFSDSASDSYSGDYVRFRMDDDEQRAIAPTGTEAGRSRSKEDTAPPN